MKVLSIGSDNKLFEEGSAVAERVKWYGNLVEELHIVNMCDSKHKFKEKQLSKNVWVCPTNSLTSVLRPIDAVRLGKKIIPQARFVRGQSLITAQDIESAWAGFEIKKKWRIPLEVQLHTDPFSPYFKGFQNRVRKFFARMVLANADGVRVVSEDLKSRILNLKSNANVYVLPIYVDKEKIEKAPVKFDVHAKYHWNFVILSVSRLNQEKNVSMTIDILAKVRNKYPNTGLIVVGSGPEEKNLKLKAKSLKLEHNIVFEGFQTDLASYYKTSNLFVQTSLFEGYGMALVEAGLSGLPVITTPVGLAKELEHGKDAYIYSLDDKQSFVDGVLDLIENNYKRENLKDNLKQKLDSKLISKESYLKEIKSSWEKLAKNVV